MDERKWRFRSRDTGFERVTPLRLCPEVDGSSCVDGADGQSGVGQWLPSSLGQPRQRRRRGGLLLTAMSNPTMALPVIFAGRSSQIPLGWLPRWHCLREDRPAQPPISATIFDYKSVNIFYFQALISKKRFFIPDLSH
jgi:hypothetical protein